MKAMRKDSLEECQRLILKMLEKSQTKVIFPVITYGLLRQFNHLGKYSFTDKEIRNSYVDAVKILQSFLGHNLHIGGKYYDAYPVRNLPKYGVLKSIDNSFELTLTYRTNAVELEKWIPNQIKAYIDSKMGIVPKLKDLSFRLRLAENIEKFKKFVADNIEINPSNFEVFSFAIIKTHLEKFACKIYRDTRTSAHDQGVDLATNFGVVFQIKKMRILNQKAADTLYSEIKTNFDTERMTDGKVVIVIDDISKEVKNYLVNMKIQTISRLDLLNLLEQFSEVEDRLKMLRVIYDEFRREYESNIS